MVCAPARCIELVQGILERRDTVFKLRNLDLVRPIFVWEPVPSLCNPEELERFYEAAHLVDVVSPNSVELAGFFGRTAWDGREKSDLEIIHQIISSGIAPDGNGLLVVRAGKDGSYTYCQDKSLWLPAYHDSNTAKDTPIADPTGAGNAFLGALAQAMVSEGRSSLEGAKSELADSKVWSNIVNSWDGKTQVPLSLVCATVAAGYVVEQVGLPTLSSSQEGELWNGTDFSQRMHLYIKKILETLEKPTQ
jgi:sugar/nucleoside kinase (ribokinase family)